MLINKPTDIKSSEITDEKTYFSRRNFMRGAALLASTTATGLLYRKLALRPPVFQPTEKIADLQPQPDAPAASWAINEKPTPFEDISNYNNYYEFSTDKRGVAEEAQGFVTRPWTVAVEGLVNKPKIFDLDEILKLSPPEERIYRHRCVEGWSMVIPWVGFSLNKLLEQAEPTSQAKYVAFQTLADPKRMPNLSGAGIPFPYVEGLRLDEAMHPLTLLASGIYGQTLLPQNGAPLRLVVPWKYGFKSIKSIVKIRLTDTEPKASWNDYAPDEYGFYSNVNPQVNHPRWTQASERRIGEYGRRQTLMFNGYGNEVASLYTGMDLRKYF
ncbi:MAG: protein-methionine-sulfoxide reductase catalytic subunit MsrP [Pyrinomonadaceae bacterium]